jgi:Ran GTPase-activating protein (RanGAP) involved in mRNA processing and transport
MENINENSKLTDVGKFNKIKKKELYKIFTFLTEREVICILTNLNKKMKKYIEIIFEKHDLITQCLKEIKSTIKSIEEYKAITNNHCTSLDDTLRKYKDQYTLFTYNKSIDLLSYSLFKELNSLDLSKNNIGVDGLLLLGPLIVSSKNLNNLNLSYNNLADEGCKFLGEFVRQSSSLQNLSLDCNAITDDGIISLSECIATHKSLKTIKFVLNQIAFEGVKILASMLEKFSSGTICVIDMKYNNIIIRDDSSLEYFRKLRICF